MDFFLLFRLFLKVTKVNTKHQILPKLRAGRAAPRDFPRVKSEGNPEEQPCQPEENPVLPDSFTQIYILFPTRFFKVLKSAGE